MKKERTHLENERQADRQAHRLSVLRICVCVRVRWMKSKEEIRQLYHSKHFRQIV